jgi:16S rRNA (guanine966-N2)-methyltransferase
MRIIAGEKRGLKLLEPKDQRIRPTTDKVRGAVFNTLQGRLADAGVFVDLFGGSGAMGIEALSRGVEKAYFFDKDRDSVALIGRNLKKAGYEGRATLMQMPAAGAAGWLAAQGITCDFLFMDPPYVLGPEMPELIADIFVKKIVKTDGILMMEHEKSVIMPVSIAGFNKVKEKKYGVTVISYYE